jgi:hypothetical protein
MDEQTLELRRKIFLVTPPMQPYQYSGALLDRKIRLLHLNLDSASSIRSRSVVSSLQGVEYIALSYTWGDTTYRVPIECDGNELLVTWNLYTALKQLRADKVSWSFLDRRDLDKPRQPLGEDRTNQNDERDLHPFFPRPDLDRGRKPRLPAGHGEDRRYCLRFDKWERGHGRHRNRSIRHATRRGRKTRRESNQIYPTGL